MQMRWSALGEHPGACLGAVVLAALHPGGCAASDVQASGCTDHDDCNPGYSCHRGDPLCVHAAAGALKRGGAGRIRRTSCYIEH
jgi:hypothetical protein